MGRGKKTKTTSMVNQKAEVTESSEVLGDKASTPTSPQGEQQRKMIVGDALQHMSGMNSVEALCMMNSFHPREEQMEQTYNPTMREPRKVIYMDELLNCLDKFDAALRPIMEEQDAKINNLCKMMEGQMQVNAALNSKFTDVNNLAMKLSDGFDRILSSMEGQVSITNILREDIFALQVQAKELDKILKEEYTPPSQKELEEKVTAMMNKEASFEEMALHIQKLEADLISQPQVERGRMDELSKAFADHESSLEKLRAEMQAYGKSEDYSQRLDGQAIRLGIVEDQLEKIASLEDCSSRLIEENKAKFESIQDELKSLTAFKVDVLAAPRVACGKKPTEVKEERPKSKEKIRQMWVRRVWVPSDTLDKLESKKESSFTLEGKKFKWVKPYGFPWRKVKKPPSLGVWS